MIFVDTTVWVGDADRNDELHSSAHALVESVRTGSFGPALITDFVIDEVVTILGMRRGFGGEKARDVALSLLASPRVICVFADEELLKESLKAYPVYRGELSLTDVLSVVVMTKYNIREIFSHDKDFDRVKGLRRKDTV